MGTALNVFPSPISAASFMVRVLWSSTVLVLNPKDSRCSGLRGFKFTKSCPRLSVAALSSNPKLSGLKILLLFPFPHLIFGLQKRGCSNQRFSVGFGSVAKAC